MKLAERLLAGSLAIIGVLAVAVVLIAGGRLRDRLAVEQTEELTRDARLVATQWRPATDADQLADTAAAALGYRVTLIAANGVVVGDSEFAASALRRLGNYSALPEIGAARARGVGVAHGPSDTGDEELAVAIPHPNGGFVRVAVSTARFDEIVRGARRDIIVASLIGLVAAVLLTLIFSRSVSRPVGELRDVARAIAAGDLSARPALSAPGEVGDLAAALHTMTAELARRLEALHQEEGLLLAVIETLNEGVLAVTDRGAIARINDRARSLLKVSADVPFPVEMLPRNAAIRQAIDRAVQGDSSDPVEAEVGGRTLVVTARPLTVGGAVVTLFDLTPMRRLETVRQDFAANVSHELKTPLTVVHGFAETLMLDPDLSPQQRRSFVEAIVTNATRMQRIVDDLLDLSRIESGGWRPNPVWIDLRGLVHDVLTSVESTAARKDLRLAAEHDGAARVFADPTAVRQILSNLVENAVRHTATGRIVVRSEPTAEGVWVRVRDTGVGIAPEHLPRIFERFYRIDPSRSRAEGGTGLGLAIVKHLAEAHGGRVAAESEVGRGTTVSVYFPDGPGD